MAYAPVGERKEYFFVKNKSASADSNQPAIKN
jgi:hypothetical protein